MGEQGLFAWIRKTSFLEFFMYWIVSIFVFAVIYWIAAAFVQNSVGVDIITFNGVGILHSIHGSFLAATMFGIGLLQYSNVFQILAYVQIGITIAILLILINKIIKKYLPHQASVQDKKVNTVVLMMSIFRDDTERYKTEIKNHTRKTVEIKEIEATIDGLYVAFLDIEKLFSAKNVHKHHIAKMQYRLVATNMENSLDALHRFLNLLEHHNIVWKDKSTEFWIRYILETADKIIMHIEETKDPQITIAVENIREFVEKIETKLE